MASRVTVSRPYAAEVHRVTSESVALQAEAQSVHERRLALEEAMRQERNRRLQQAARRKPHPVRKDAGSIAAAPQGREAPSVPANGSSGQPKKTPGSPPDDNQLPHNLDEYRCELDSTNGNKEVYRLNYYTSAHINPADVHFYKAKGRIRELQRHAPSPLRLQPSPPRPSRRDEDATQLLSIVPPTSLSPDGTAEQWTKSAVLRMQANQRALRRIHEREEWEAALTATRSAAYAASAQRRQAETALQPLPRTVTPPPARPLEVAAAVEPVPSAAPLPKPHPAPSTSSAAVGAAPHERLWRSARTRSSAFTTAASAAVLPSGVRWSLPQYYEQPERSPPRAYASGTPSRRYSDGALQSLRVGQNLPFKPSLTYSSSSTHASRVESSSVFATAAALERRATNSATSPWRPLHDSWTSPSRRAARSAYQPIAPQNFTAASITPWESRRSWEGLTRHSSPSRFYDEHKPSLFSAVSAPVAVAREKAEVEVSPLTPSPAVKTAPRSTGGSDGAGKTTTGASAVLNLSQQKPSLLDGFRMPDTVLKRDDLFQGTS